MDAPTPAADPAPHTVAAIFARAERVFERRVDQLLQLKRHKARLAGTAFNARKAKRDARTVAGREKLDALVRRLADLATVQEAALGPARAADLANSLDASAAAVLGFAALSAAQERECAGPAEHAAAAERQAEQFAHPPGALPVSPASAPEDLECVKDVLDTSSCSDDCSVGGCLSNFKDLRDALDPEAVGEAISPDEASRPAAKPCDRHMFSATESVVNFVLECDDDNAMYAADKARGDGYGRYNVFPRNQPVNRYECRSGPPPCRPGDWAPRRYPLQSASSL